MNFIQCIDLFHEIFNKPLPDINKIQRYGLLAIKIAQTFALRIDFLGQEKCIELSKLYTHVNALPSEQLNFLLKEYETDTWKQSFREIEALAFSSASVGQVHSATLTDGTNVAVKVLKRNFREDFEADVTRVLQLMKIAIRVYPKLSKVADPVGILETIRKFTVDELDLTNEIKHKKVLEEIYENHKDKYDLSKLKFMKIYNHLSSKHILVSDKIEGETFDTLLSQGKLSYDTLLQLFHIHGFYMFSAGIFHGDIHPGNLILSGDNIYFVDYGALGKASERLRKGLFYFFTALSEYDYERCAHFLQEMSVKKLSQESYQTYQTRFIKLYQDFTNKTVSEVSLTKKMMDTIKLGVHSGLEFEKGMFSIIKSLMYLDGMVLRCQPNAILLKDMRQFISQLQPYI